MPDQMYHDLKLVSQRTGVPMAKFIKINIEPEIKKTIAKTNKTNKSNYHWLKDMAKNASRAKNDTSHLTDDELLYG